MIKLINSSLSAFYALFVLLSFNYVSLFPFLLLGTEVLSYSPHQVRVYKSGMWINGCLFPCVCVAHGLPNVRFLSSYHNCYYHHFFVFGSNALMENGSQSLLTAVWEIYPVSLAESDENSETAVIRPSLHGVGQTILVIRGIPVKETDQVFT